MPASKNPSRPGASQPEIVAYRPFWDRLTFILSLIGILVVVHLWIQKDRGFDQGCFGFSAPTAVEESFNCQAVVSSGAGDFLGVSNVVWGLLFYVIVALLSFEITMVKGSTQARHKKVRAVIVWAGLLYTGYLVYYQYFVLKEFCALCLTSAVIVLLLSIVQGIDFKKPNLTAPSRMNMKKGFKEAGLYASFAVVALLLVGADISYFRNIEPSQPTVAAQTNQPVEALPAAGPAECAYSTEKQPIANYKGLVDFQDPVVGNKNSKVTVIEVFEPNCPHCAATHPVMKNVVQQYKNQAVFYFKPVRFWPISTMQMGALYAAAQQGKFFEMMDLQMANQHRGGMSVDELKGYAKQIGMNPDQMAQKINAGAFESRIASQRSLIVDQFGINSVPAILINGRFVGNPSEECIGQLIAQAAKSK